MTTQTFLFHYGQYIAYGATWLIHCVYLATLVTRYRRQRKELKDLAK